MPVVIITGHGTMETVIEALRNGAADFLNKPVKLFELDAVLAKCGYISGLRKEQLHLRETIRGLQVSEDQRARNRRFVGVSEATQRIRAQIRQAVEAECDTILITGDTGTGKEVVARELHFQRGNDESPFIAVSCPALPESLIESELFGHVKGAFTGATADKAGCFELADGGTLFLDEIADLSPSAQAKLLRVLETRTLRRIGGAGELEVDVRVVAATNTALEELVEAGKFRADLYYRLNLFTIWLPPLRERPEDIMPLAEHFLAAYKANRVKGASGFSKAVCSLLEQYDYPGNARELRNIVERAAILCGCGEIQPEHLSIPEQPAQQRPGSATAAADDSEDDERARLLAALEDTKWNRRRAAKVLGMPYSTLRYKLKTLQLDD